MHALRRILTTGRESTVVTEVTRKRVNWGPILILFIVCSRALAQVPPPTPSSLAAHPAANASDPAKPAEQLYLQLRHVGLNPARTFKVRGASIDRPGLHLTFEDGTIAFTNDVQGRITGGFFEGDGEVLLAPPTREERASMALGTGMAILEERFNTAYLRFNDDTFADFQPFLRPSPDAQEFAARFDSSAQNLAELDALRVFVTFSRSLPVAGDSQSSGTSPAPQPPGDHFLHARVDGVQLGPFDIHYDSLSYEQLSAGQNKDRDGVSYYDLWTSFSPNPLGTASSSPVAPQAEDFLRIQSYKISAQVNPPTDLTVGALLNVKINSSGDRTVLFELSRFLQVKQVEVNGHPVEFINNPALEGTQLARRGNDLVAVVFPQPLQAGDQFMLHFVYGGTVLSEAGGGLLYVGARGAWYPSRRLVPCDFDLTFRYPRGWTLIATGTRVSGGGDETPAETTSSSLLEDRWKTERPIALAGFNLGKYVKASAQAGSILVETYAARGVEKDFPHTTTALPPLPDMRGLSPSPDTEAEVLHTSAQPSPAKHAQAVANEAARAVEFFQQRLGPFPYHSLALTQMPGPVSQGWPGLIFLSSLAFLSPDEAEGLHLNPARASLRRLALPHETAHQWWGDLVIWKSYRDQWIVEALANYCALMQLEAEHPEEFRAVLEQYRKDLLAKGKNGEILRDAGPVTLGQRLSNSHFPDGYEAVSYGRGTWLFHMLRYMLLDAERDSHSPGSQPAADSEPFTRILRRVSERYAGQAIDTHQLLAAFAENLPPALRFEGKQSLDWFEQSWVRGTAMPEFAIRNLKITPKASASVVSGILLQKEAPLDLVTSVPVYAMVGRKNVFVACVLADGPETTFHLTAPAGTRSLLIDPNGTILTGNK
jgi:Peptidase family M1 domain